MKVMSLLLSMLAISIGVGIGQPTIVTFYVLETDFDCPCGTGTLLPGGTEFRVYRDFAPSGYDEGDTVVAAGTWWPDSGGFAFGEGIESGSFYGQLATPSCCWLTIPVLIAIVPGPNEIPLENWFCLDGDCSVDGAPEPPTDVRVWPIVDHDFITWVHSGANTSGFTVRRSGNLIGTFGPNRRTFQVERQGTPHFDYCVAAFNSGGQSDSICADHLSYNRRFTAASRAAWEGWVDPFEPQTVTLEFEGVDSTAYPAAVALYLEHNGVIAETLAVDTNVTSLNFMLPLICWNDCRLLLKATSLEWGAVQWDTTAGFFYTIFDFVPDHPDVVPRSFGISRIYPNPFNAEANLDFEVRVDGPVTMDLFDLQGRFVRRVLEETRFAGQNRVHLAAGDLASGIYLLRLKSEGHTAIGKMVIVK